jgi:CheY-like chemotaxis protein/signal transduction histidine kinase
MKRSYLIIIMTLLFFLSLTFFSIWWMILAVIVTLMYVAYKTHLNRMEGLNAKICELSSTIIDKTEQIEKGIQNEKNSRNKLEEIQSAKTTFLNKISHEIRSPMNGMMGMAALLKQTTLNTEQEDYLQIIQTSGRNMISTINDILFKTLSNSSIGDNEGKPGQQAQFNLRNCIEEILILFSVNAEESGTELICHIDYNIPEFISANEIKLKQILYNLIENAVRHTNGGEIFVDVTPGSPNLSDKIDIVFEVRDTGSGITDERLAQIVRNMAETTKDKADTASLGQGLINSKRLVNSLGGELIVQHVSKGGTSIHFNMLININPLLSEKRNLLNRFPDGKRVLIVTGNSSLGNVLSSQLKEWNLVPLVAESGERALGILSGLTPFDLVLSDEKLADTDGISLALRIRSQAPAIPLILMTYSQNKESDQHVGLFNAIIAKPVLQNILYKKLMAGLGSKEKYTIKDSNGSVILSDNFSKIYPLHILIAEDNPVNQLFAVKILTKLGYKPEIAANGEEVLEIVSQVDFDLILMDVQMPLMDGLEATRMIRLCLKAQPVIIAMTANAMQGDRELCIQSGMDDYLSKPVELEELLRILEKWSLASRKNS